ncbi:MAG: hypothetical protein FJ276_19660 [Planctomycetes bacterium]|nr:hypothetical protein [Planctomycetota bacterium]
MKPTRCLSQTGRRRARLCACFVCGWLAGLACGAEMPTGLPCRLAAVPDQPLIRDRNTTLLAHFDAADHNTADFARHHRDDMGYHGDPSVEGKFGSGVAVHGTDGFVLFSGLDNYDRWAGTAEFWVRCDAERSIWADGVGRWLLVLYPERGEYDVRYGMTPCFLSLYKSPEDQLVFKLYEGGLARYAAAARLGQTDTGKSLSLPVKQLDPAAWHHVVCTWDLRPPGRLWLLVDGQGVTCELNRPADAPGPNPGNFILLGGFSGLPGDNVRASDCRFDDFRLQSGTLEHRLVEPTPPARTVAPVDEARLLETEDAARGMVDFLLQRQSQGGLLPQYTWPALTSSGWGDIGRGVDMWFSGSARLGETLARAWRIWGDDRYLDGAIAAANMFCDTQFPEGAWAFAYTFTRGQMLPKYRSVYIAQAMQSNQIRFLSLMWRLVGDPRYEQAIRRAGDWHASIQFPSGAWGWEAYPLGHTGPYGHPALNDAVTPQAMEDLFVIWCATGDDKYLAPLKAGGQWIIDAQSGPPLHGWADQYDERNNFIWMRNFEPPAVSMQAAYSAMRGLLLMYDRTGEDKYLEPIRKALTWMETVPEDARGWLWYAHRDYSAEENQAVVRTAEHPDGVKQGVPIRAGEPVVAYYNELLPVTHPKAVQEIIPRLAAHYGVKFAWPEAAFRDALAVRKEGPVFSGRFGTQPRARFAQTAPTVADFAAQFHGGHAAIVAKLSAFARGEPGDLVSQHRDYGRCFNPDAALSYCEQLLDDIEAARVALGDHPPAWIPRYGRGGHGTWIYLDPPRDYFSPRSVAK